MTWPSLFPRLRAPPPLCRVVCSDLLFPPFFPSCSVVLELLHAALHALERRERSSVSHTAQRRVGHRCGGRAASEPQKAAAADFFLIRPFPFLLAHFSSQATRAALPVASSRLAFGGAVATGAVVAAAFAASSSAPVAQCASKVPAEGIAGTNLERTFIAIKPDGVQRQLIGKIIQRFEVREWGNRGEPFGATRANFFAERMPGFVVLRCVVQEKGFTLVAMKMLTPTKAQAEGHYDDLKSKPFFRGLTTFFSSGPIVAMVWQGKGSILTGRKLLGETDPAKVRQHSARCIQSKLPARCGDQTHVAQQVWAFVVCVFLLRSLPLDLSAETGPLISDASQTPHSHGIAAAAVATQCCAFAPRISLTRVPTRVSSFVFPASSTALMALRVPPMRSTSGSLPLVRRRPTHKSHRATAARSGHPLTRLCLCAFVLHCAEINDWQSVNGPWTYEKP